MRRKNNPIRRSLATVGACALFALSLAGQALPAHAQKRQQVQLPEGTILDQATQPVLTLDGSVGFLTPAMGDSVIAFAVRTGEMIGTMVGLGSGTRITLHDDGSKRLLAVTADVGAETQTAQVTILDASNAAELQVVTSFSLDEALTIAPGARAEFTRGGKFCIVPIVAPVSALVVFDAHTGQQVGALTFDAPPDRVSLVETATETRIAVTSVEANKISIVSVNEDGVILPLASVSLPDDAKISPANNVAFDATGKVGYVASLQGRALLSFSSESGEVIDRIDTDGSSARVTVYHGADSDQIAVVNVSRPGVEDITGVEASARAPLGLPGAVIFSANLDGKLVERSRFYPETGDEIAPTNNADFNADGSQIFVPARTGALYVVDTATGDARHKELLDSHVQSIASAPLAESVAVVTAGGSEGRLDILSSFEPTVDEPKATGDDAADPDAEPGATEARDATADAPERESKKAKHDKDNEADGAGANLEIARVAPASVQSGRRRDLAVTLVGSGFRAGATVLIGEEVYSALVSKNSRRISFTLTSARLAVPTRIPVQVRNPDGSLSNIAELEVVSPYAPVVTKVSPESVNSGRLGFDLKVRGDHFRDGAVVRATYQDESGQTQTLELKTYRLSFTQIVARFPYKLTRRARQVSLTVVDRDGAAASEPVMFTVAGPTVASITPERFVAGDLSAGETTTIKITGENFHSDVAVFVRRPARDGATEPTYKQVSSGNLRWFNSNKIKIKLSSQDLLYAGALSIRVVNPVSGVKKRNGDAVEANFTIAGPAIADVSPTEILAGSEHLSLKIQGADFRRGAVVRLKRTDASGEVRRRITVDDPKFKDRGHINIPFNAPELLRLIAKPGTLVVRIINPNAADGVPSEQQEIHIVGPSLAEYTLAPKTDDPAFYRLTLTGEHFAEGALIQILDSAGNAVGKPVEAKFKSQTSLTALLDRGKLTRLQTFKVVVLNPGGPFNAGGVASNALDVILQ